MSLLLFYCLNDFPHQSYIRTLDLWFLVVIEADCMGKRTCCIESQFQEMQRSHVHPISSLLIFALWLNIIGIRHHRKNQWSLLISSGDHLY